MENNQEHFCPVERSIELLTAFKQGKKLEFSPIQFNIFTPLIICQRRVNFDFNKYKYRVK